MQMIYANGAPDLLICRELDAQYRMSRQHTPAIAMTMNGQLAERAHSRHARQSHVIETGHDTCAAGGEHRIMMPAHSIQLVADIKCIHNLSAKLIAEPMDLFHDTAHSLLER